MTQADDMPDDTPGDPDPDSLREQYALALAAVSTAELEAAAAETGGRTWAEIRARLCPT